MSPGVRGPSSGSTARAAIRPLGPVVNLHIYDVSGEEVVQQVNDMFRPLQTGMFHAAVEVLGKEWSFGYTVAGPGITCCEPRGDPQHKYRETLEKGRTPLSEKQVLALLDRMKKEWRGCQYDLLTRNCCHFSDALCRELGVGPAPDWVTHMASTGAMLRSGVNQAVTQAHAAAGAAAAAAGAAAARASELDAKYQISSKVDDFTTREVAVDEEYLRSRAKDLWSQASQRLSAMGSLAERVISDAQKPIALDVGGVETAAMSFWAWATGEKAKVGEAVARTPLAEPLAGAGVRVIAPPAKPALSGGDTALDDGRDPPSESPSTAAPAAAAVQPAPAAAAAAPQAAALARAGTAAQLAAATPPAVASTAEPSFLTEQEQRPRGAAEEAKRQAEFAASALDFTDVETARACLRKALASLEPSPAEAPRDAPPSTAVPHKTMASAQKKAESAASLLDGGDKLASAAALREALLLLQAH